MKYGCRLLSFLACGLLLMLVACVAASGGKASKTVLSATVLTGGRQCLPAPETWTATWIESPAQLLRFMSRCYAHRLGIDSVMPPAVDFDRFRVLALEMGRQPSAGYGIDTKRVTAFMQGQSGIVAITYHHPVPGSITAQMVTSPWILIRLPIGPFEKVRVVDQNFRQLTQTTINPQ
jgi:hypothetical protein